MAGEDDDYTAWVRRQRCRVPGQTCTNPAEVHHPRHNVGLAQRAHDHRALALCHQHHADLHALSGPFKGWVRDMVRAYCDEEGALLLALYYRQHPII